MVPRAHEAAQRPEADDAAALFAFRRWRDESGAVMDAATLDETLALWELLSGLSADADMLLAAAVYLCPALQGPDFPLKPEPLPLNSSPSKLL